MPFQSEKQRRFLHANHPEIAKRWERDYAHGGILDINESEEIIDDGGNEIELTDYNAAFDDPNDLSTGVKSLFRAKEGGNVRLGPHKATDLLAKKNPDGTRSKYQPPGGGATSLGSGRDVGGGQGSDRGPRDDPDRFGPTTTTTTTTSTGGDGDARERYIAGISDEAIEARRQRELKQMIAKQQLEKGPIEYYGSRKNLIDLQNKQTELTTRIQEKITGDWKRYMDPSTWEKVKNIYAFTSISGAIKEIFKGIKRTSDMRAFMQDLKDIGLAGGPPGTNDPLYDELWLHLEKMDPKYKKDDDTGGDGPIYAPLTGAVDESYAQGYYDDGMSDLDRIRAGQAKYAAYIDKIEREKAMFANKGGLANLFRVKKQ